VRDPFDPAQNINAGTRYLKQLLDRYKSDLRLTLAAYNAGPQRVEPGGDVPAIAETRAYVQAIIRELQVADEPTELDEPTKE
jgi:soluble lytic murein transglycosylase-like protein